MAGKLEGIWLKRASGGPMDPAEEAVIVESKGIEGDASFGRSNRQVTVIEREVFDGLRGELPGARPEMRRANIMVSGVGLEGSQGKVLVLGEARILLRGETRPCELMDEQCQGLRGALGAGWGGGAHGVVTGGGRIRVGDPVALAAPAPTEVAAGQGSSGS